MKIEHYQEFLRYQEVGLRKKASESVRSFISSFQNENEVEDWVWSTLPDLQSNRHSRVRHEIFGELVYPVLKRGLLEHDFKSMLWLGKLIQNIYQVPALHKDLDYATDRQLFGKCFELQPDDPELRALLLKCIVDRLGYCIHEWPSGILYGNDGATLAQCQELRGELEFAKELDVANRYGSFLVDVHGKLAQYESQLKM